jgi:DNA replication protein DnaC
MSNRHHHLHELLRQDLAKLKLRQIVETYQEVLDEAARKNTSMLEVLAHLMAAEVTVRHQRALERRMRQAKLPPRKTLEDYDFTFPKRVPKQKVLRLFDCEFVAQHHCAVLIGQTGTGKSHLLNALGYTACEKGISVRWTRAIDMINVLTTAQINGTLEKKLKEYTRPDLLLLDELGYLPIDKRGADLMFQVVAARYECGSIVITTNRVFREWGKIFDVDNTLATAIIDRLMHHGDALVIEGKSYRTKDNGNAGKGNDKEDDKERDKDKQ